MLDGGDHIRIGHDPVYRPFEDRSLSEGGHILWDSPIPQAGNTSLWAVYFLPAHDSSQVKFQIWRPSGGYDGPNLVGETDFKTVGTIKGRYVFELGYDEMIMVDAGDVMGFQYKEGNPIPYDNSCRSTNSTSYDCWAYSLQVEVIFHSAKTTKGKA